MLIDLAIPSTAKLVLWVEDSLTREYLRAIWDYPIGFVFPIGGGNESVSAIVRAFEEAGHRNVFGVTDRDFRPTNFSDWMSATKTFRTFVLPVHEIENYLLNAGALQASGYQNRGLEVAEIEEKMVKKAGDLCWWAACRETIAELKR